MSDMTEEDKEAALLAVLTHVFKRLDVLASLRPMDDKSRDVLWHRTDELNQLCALLRPLVPDAFPPEEGPPHAAA